MKKRAISIMLVAAVLLVSFPFSFASASTADESSVYTGILDVDRVINDFNNVPTSGTETVGDYTVNVGVGRNDVQYTVNDYSATTFSAKNTLTIENGALKSTLTGSDIFSLAAYISPVSKTRGNTMPSTETVALQFHVDLSGITSVEAGSKVTFEPEIYLSTGRNSGAVGYCNPNETFIYIPDATDENPNPTPEVLTTGGGRFAAYHGYVWGYAGQSGTIIVPFDVWTTDEVKQFSGYNTVWDLHKYTYDYIHRSYISFETYGKKYAVGDEFVIDDICWMQKKGEKAYDKTVVVEDFSSANSGLGGWGNGVAWSAGTNVTIENGKLKLYKSCDGAGRATTQFAIASWDETYDAFAFDFDASNMVNKDVLGSDKSYIRMSYAVKKTDTTAYASNYFNGTFKFVWEDGTTLNGTAASYGQEIPYGFKGKVIVPKEAVNLSADVKAGLAAGGESLFYLEIMGMTAAQKGTYCYVDNFVYYDNNEQLADSVGIDFSSLEEPYYETVAPITEDPRTIEVYFNTESNFDQSILATKFEGGNNGTGRHRNMINLRVTSTGQLILEIGTARIDVVNCVLNDGKWHHVAVVADEANSKIMAYVDGSLSASADMPSITVDKSMDYLPTTIGNHLAEASKDHKVFDGKIANIRMWSDVRTAEELKSNAMVSVGADAEGLIAEWMLTGEDFAKETTGKYNLKTFFWNIDAANKLFEKYNRDAAEGEYTMLFIPDTQSIVKDFKGQESSLFDWIIANAERLNIKAVVSLGDIVEYEDDEDSFQRMSSQYYRLTEAGIPWVPTIGDHDYDNLFTEVKIFYDKYFTVDKLYQSDWFKLGGLYDESTLVNAYFYLEANDNVKYLIMNLEVTPEDPVIAWANDVIADHPDYRVIIATHRHMYLPSCDRFTDPLESGNAGEFVWQKLVSQHKNIDAIFCGHYESPGHNANYDTGINGNKVLQVNCDLQQTDYSYKTLQAVLIGRFSEDGNIVNFNTYGTAAGLYIDSDSNDKIYQLHAEVEEVTKYTVNFTDNMGNVLDSLNVVANDVISEEAVPAVPERLGYKFIGWSVDLTQPVLNDMVVTALYEKDTDTTYNVAAPEQENVTVTLPANQEKAYYNDRVTLTAATADSEGKAFAYWVVNGSVFSYKREISFLVFDDLSVEAIYTDATVEDAVVIYTNTNSNYVLNGNKWNMQVMGVVSADKGEVTEVGILLSASKMTAAEMLAGYNANNGSVFKMASTATNGRQFLYTVKNIAVNRTRCATVYAIIDGEMVVGDAVTCITVDANGLLAE